MSFSIMYQLRNHILIFFISFITMLFSLLLIINTERKYNEELNILIDTSVSDIEIMSTNYYNMRHIYPKKYYMYNYTDYLKVFRNLVDENDITQILKYNGYIVSPRYEYKVLINGIDPEKYGVMFKNITNIISGEYINSENKYSCIIGSTIADKLKLQVGDLFIVRLLDVNNLYKVEEFYISGIVDTKNETLNKESIFVNTGILNELIADRYAFSSIHIKNKSKNVYNSIKKLLPDDIGIYTKYDINNSFTLNENNFFNIKRYIYLFFCILVFSIYFYINSKAFRIYKLNSFNSYIIKNIFYSLLGFVLAVIVLVIFLRERYNINFTLLFIINIIVILVSSFIPYIYTKKRV